MATEPAAGTGAGLRRVGSVAGTHLSRMSYLYRWLILAPIIGAIAGVGAIVFYEVLRLTTHLFLYDLAGYQVPTPAGEGLKAGSAHYTRLWAIPLSLVLGGILSGFLVFTWAPEAEGHGTDAAIDAVHHNPRGIRVRAVVIKIIASALTIGSGGSGGREGPTAQISAGFGSLLTRFLDLSPQDGRIAVSVGIGSGIGAIFSAPFGGAVLAADIVYRDDFEYVALVPGLFASIVAYAIFGAVYGYRPLFAVPGYHFNDPVQLLWFALIGMLAGGIGLLYSANFYGIIRLNSRLPFTRKLRPALGALLVGLLALWLPQVLGTGYGWVQKALSDTIHLPLYIILLLPLARILATSLSIGTGGSGGVFGPGMVIGAFTGLAVWRVFEPFAPGVGHDPAPFVIVGMMAVFGSISRAPLAVMLMVAEMTGNLSIIAPAMVAVAIAAFIVSRTDDSIYRSQLRTRADSEAGRLQFGMPLLQTLTVAQVARRPPRVLIHQGTPASEVLAELEAAHVAGAPVVDNQQLYLGTVEREHLAAVLKDDPGIALERVIDQTTATVPETLRVDEALEPLSHAGGRWVTVTAESRHVTGVLAVSDILEGYRSMLRTSFAQMSKVSEHATVVEEHVGRGSVLIGQRLGDLDLPGGAMVITVGRDDELLFATASTVLEQGDLVTSLCSPEGAADLAQRIRGEEEPVAPMVERGSHMV